MGKIIDLIGQNFDGITVSSFAFLDKFNRASWNCTCDCGNKMILTSAALKKYHHHCKECTISWKIKDLTNKKFGRITVISLFKSSYVSKEALWNCVCDCGNKLILNSSTLKRGLNPCIKCRKKYRIKDLTGKKFKNITVISRIEEVNNNGDALWNCICDCCSNKLILSSPILKDINHNHCKECYNGIKNLSGRIINLTGKKFGSITVVSFAELGKFKNARWNCVCDCGNKLILDAHSIDKKKDNDRCHKCVKRGYQDETLSSKNNLYARYKGTCAELRGYSFSLSFEDFINLTQQNCYYCGAPPTNYKKLFDAKKGYFYNGLDRIDNTKGYDLSNVKPCCTDCNYAKGTLTEKEFVDWVKKCHNYLNSKGLFLDI